MIGQSPFKWRHFQPEIMLLSVRWYVQYPLSYRQLEEMMAERGLMSITLRSLAVPSFMHPNLSNSIALCEAHDGLLAGR